LDVVLRSRPPVSPDRPVPCAPEACLAQAPSHRADDNRRLACAHGAHSVL